MLTIVSTKAGALPVCLAAAALFCSYYPSSTLRADARSVVEATTAPFAVHDLRIEATRTPLGIDSPQPSISWLLSSPGTIPRDEMLDAVPARHADADKNNDGVVTLDEMKGWRATAMKAPPE